MGPPSVPTGITGGSVFFTVGSAAALFSGASAAQPDRLHAVTTPAGKAVQLARVAQIKRDSVHASIVRLPIVLGSIAVITFVLLFMLTPAAWSCPLKAVLLNVLSLSAAFGALVWVFQDGHLGGVGSSVLGVIGNGTNGTQGAGRPAGAAACCSTHPGITR